MAYDRNPHYGRDYSFTEGARRVADLLWETTGGDLSSFPPSYLENLRHEFSDGKVSMLEVIDKVDLGPEATYEDYCEMVEILMGLDASICPDPADVVEVQPSHLLFEIEGDPEFQEFSFAEEVLGESVTAKGPDGSVTGEEVVEEGVDPLSERMELFFKKVIASVYLDGVTAVSDAEGNPPNAANNYLLSPDGKTFSGIFYDNPPNEKGKSYAFEITESRNGTWSIRY